MNFRLALLAAATGLIVTVASAGPPIEIASQAAPHGTAPRQWLQRLAEAGAGTARLVGARGGEQPRIETLGESARGEPLLKVYAVLTRSNELLLPGETSAKRFRLSDRTGLADYFERLDAEGEAGVTTQRGKHGLSEAEFTDLFTRLQRPLGPIADSATLTEIVQAASRIARVEITSDPSIDAVLQSKSDNASSISRLATGTALAVVLSEQGLALKPNKPLGKPARLTVVAKQAAKEPWPVGYKPERSPSRTAPALMEFLTVEVEGYTLAEALDAIVPRLTWNDGPLPIVWDHFAMRSRGIDPTTVQVRFPSKRTYYKKLLDQLVFQARLKLDLRVDEAGTPFLYLTR